MEFGLFGHLDRNDQPDAALYADRLRIIEAADAAGFRVNSAPLTDSRCSSSR